MFLVWVRTVFRDTMSSRAMSGPSRSVAEQPKHVQLAFAQRLDQALWTGCRVLGLVDCCQESADIVPGDPLFRGRSQQRAIGGPSSTKIRT